MDNLEHLSDSDTSPEKKTRRLPNGIEWLEQYKKRNKEKDLTECPDCHNKYDWQTMANEPFRTIMGPDGENKRKACVDCYFKWVGDNPSRYFGNIEETPEGFCQTKNLPEEFDSR